MHGKALYSGRTLTVRRSFAGAHHGSRFYTKAVFRLRFLGVALMLVYLVLMPSGNFGLILTLPSFALVCFGINKSTLGMFFLLFGPCLIGFLFRLYGIAGVGAALSEAMGLVLVLVASRRQPDGARRISFDSKILINTLKRPGPLLWLVTTEMVLLTALLYGPLTAPCYTKLILYTIGLITGLVAFEALVYRKEIDLFQLGLLAIAGSVIYLCLSMTILGGSLSGRIWVAAAWRSLPKEEILSQGEDLLRPRSMVLSYLCGGGLICFLAGGRGRPGNSRNILLLCAAGAVGLLVTLASGHRLWLGILPLAIAATAISRPKERRLLGGLLVLAIIFISFSVFRSLQEENRLIQQTFGSENSTLVGRANRDINWDAAIERIGEKPILGHGLGGYYVEGFGGPGDGMYAHNLVLELLSETGIVGACIILLPPIFFLIRAGRRLFQLRTAGGASIMPFLIMVGMYSMFTQSLPAASADLFGLVAVLWAAMAPRRRTKKNQRYSVLHEF